MLSNDARAECITAVDELLEKIKNNTISESAGTLLTAAAAIERGEALPAVNDGEEVSGLVLVLCGDHGTGSHIIEGGFIPEVAYGHLMGAALNVYTSSQMASFEGPVKSMVANMLADGNELMAQAEQARKDITKPDEH